MEEPPSSDRPWKVSQREAKQIPAHVFNLPRLINKPDRGEERGLTEAPSALRRFTPSGF